MRHDPLAFFNLEVDADARAVKRAYAQRLKLTRPDDDPAGFQRLHDAYQRALAWCADREQGPAWQAAAENDAERAARTDTIAQPERPLSLEGSPLPADMLLVDPAAKEHPSADAPPDFDALLKLVVGHALRDAPADLAPWLRKQPVLWSLTTKPVIGNALLSTVHQSALPISPETFDVLASFFEWHQLGNGIDPLFMRRLRHVLYLSWMLRQPSPMVLGLFLRRSVAREFTDGRTERARKQLTRPFSRLQAMWASLWPMWPTWLHRALHALESIPGRAPVPPLDPMQVRFWFDAGDRSRLSKTRLQVGAFRCAVIAALLFALFTATEGSNSPTLAAGIWQGMTMSLALSVWIVGAWIVCLLVGPLFRWLVAPADSPGWPWLRLSLPAVLLGIGAMALALPGGDVAAAWLAASGTTLGLMRMVHGWPKLEKLGKFPRWLWPLALGGLRMTVVVPSQIRWLVLAGMIVWLADGARHWRRLRVLATGRA